MKSIILLATILLSANIFAAPTKHDLSKALTILSNTNDESDSVKEFKVCYYEVASYIPENLQHSRINYLASVIVKVDHVGATSSQYFKTDYSVIATSHSTPVSINLVSRKEIQENQTNCEGAESIY